MGGCFSGSQEPGPAKAPAARKDAKGPEAKNHAAAVTVQSPSKPSASGQSGQVLLGRVSMSSEKAAGNQEHARHSRANSRTSIASLGDVTLPPDGKTTADGPLLRHSEPGHAKPGAAAAASNAAGVLMDKPSAKNAMMTQRLERGWD